MAPVAGTNVALPTVEPFTVTTPVELTDTVTDTGLELVVPSTRNTLAVAEVPSAFTPAVATLSVHGLTVTLLPSARGVPEGKVDVATVKMHEPYVMAPDAVLTPEVRLKEGVAPDPESVSDVADVVPKDGTPLAKVKSLPSTPCTTAAPVVGLIAAAVLVVATSGTGVSALSPPPHAASRDRKSVV